MITICVCGHDSIGHPGDGPCMHATCDCTTWTAAPTGEAAARRIFGDAAYERSQARAEEVWEQQRMQMVFTTARLQADADHRRAQVEIRHRVEELLVLGWWLAALTVPALLVILAVAVTR
jgi:hypothetical protein